MNFNFKSWVRTGVTSVITGLGVMMPAVGWAYRPLATEDTGVAGKGVAQLEVSWDTMRWATHDHESVLLLVPIYGVTERLELSTEVPFMWHDPYEGDASQGLGDINLVAKWLLLPEHDARPAVALKGVVKTTTGDEDQGHGSGDCDYTLVGVASKGWGDFTMHAMFGYTFVGNRADPNLRDIVLFGTAVDYSFTPAWHVLAEFSGNRHPDRTATDHPLAGFVGMTYALAPRVILDGGVRLGLNDAMPDWNLTMGSTITF